jgi:hypothetical protein
MGSKAKSRCRFGMLKVNKFSQSYLNVMKLENYDPTGEMVVTKPHKSFFCNNLKDTKGTKMADPILEYSLKTRLNTIYCDIFSF